MERSDGLRSISLKAKIGVNTTIGAFAVIEDDVEIGENCWIGPHVILMNGTRLGNNCRVFPGAVIGAIPQDLKFNNEYTTVNIGNNVTIREYCTINRGTDAAQRTAIGDNCLLMAYVHVAHDCIIGRNCILANNVTLAGHITIDDFARIGGLAAVHQFVRIGRHTMIGGGSLVRKDVPPYVLAAREPLSYAGINRVGLRRAKMDSTTIHHIEDIYRELFVKGYSVKRALDLIQTKVEPSSFRDEIVAFVKEAKRGLMRGYRN
jgi:UDP-N-acetylglucosamine acyltransferase